MPKILSLRSVTCLLAIQNLAGCASLPPPQVVYHDALTAVQLRADPRAEYGHSHPAVISPEQMTQILDGVRVQNRRDPLLSLMTGQPEAIPAFSTGEIRDLAPQLSKALAMATPQELVTFYRRVSDSEVGLGVTSGGLFVQEGNLFFILANHRNRPSDVMSQAVTYELDPADDPLLSLQAMSFAVSFAPAEAEVPRGARRPWRYVDPGKVVVVNLQRLPKQPYANDASPRR